MDAFADAETLRASGIACATATVVRAERPTSARPGAKALIREDGTFSGFVGGACVRPAVRRAALAAIADGKPRLLRISPDAPASESNRREEGVTEEAMPCVSGGALDIFIEPRLPAPRLLVVGTSPAAAKLRELGGALGMDVARAPGPAGPEEQAKEEEGGDPVSLAANAFVVVAGHGEGEWEALRAGLAGGRARYVGLIASPKRAAEVRLRLADYGLGAAEVGRLSSPAGLDLGAETPAEIALSILAEIIEVMRRGRRAAPQPDAAADEATSEAPVALPLAPPAPLGIALAPSSAAGDEAIDPICGMSVPKSSPHRVDRAGESFWFCCAGCAERFAAIRPAP